MNDTVIAIRTADGSWFPVLDRQSGDRKRVILTTARRNQERVNIDMYEGPRDELAQSEYIGSLVIEGIAHAEAGEVDIEFVAGVDDNNNLRAQATNLASGDSQSLSVSLLDRDALPEEPSRESMADMPDFSIGEGEGDLDDGSDTPADDEGRISFAEDLPEADEVSFDYESFGEDSGEPGWGEAGYDDEDFSLDDDLPEAGPVDEPFDDSPEPETDASGEGGEEAYDLGSQFEEPPIFDMPDELPESGGESTRPNAGSETGAGDSAEDDFGDFPDSVSDEPPEGFIAETGESASRSSRREVGSGPAATEPGPALAAGQPAQSRPSPVFFVVYMVLALGILAGVVYLVYSAFQTEPIPPLESARSVFAATPIAWSSTAAWRWRR